MLCLSSVEVPMGGTVFSAPSLIRVSGWIVRALSGGGEVRATEGKMEGEDQ